MQKETIAEQWLNLVRNRRSIRRYTPDPVPLDIVESLLESANWAPSAHNRQPWRFAVITDPGKRNDLALAMGARLREDAKDDGLDKDTIDRDVECSFGRIAGAPLLCCSAFRWKTWTTMPTKDASSMS